MLLRLCHLNKVIIFNVKFMKKLYLFLAVMLGTLTAHAEDYTYLTFVTSDGAKTSVSVSSLTMSISGTTLTAGSKTFTLSDLTKMYFSTSDETATDIKSISVKDLKEYSEVYDLNGKKMSKDKLKKGVYIVKTKTGNYKIVVK